MTCKCEKMATRVIEAEMSEGLTLLGARYKETYCTKCGKVHRSTLLGNYRRYASNNTGMMSKHCEKPSYQCPVATDIVQISKENGLAAYARKKAFPLNKLDISSLC